MGRIVRRAALVSVLIAAVPADDAISAPVCLSKRAHTVAREGAVHVRWVPVSANSPYGRARYYVCRGIHATYLARTTDTRYIRPVRIRWPFVAYGYEDRDRISGTAGLALWSARSRRTQRCPRTDPAPRSGTRTQTRIIRILLTGGGQSAFSVSLRTENDIDPVIDSYEIWRFDREGCGSLDTGEDIAPASLGFAGSSRVTWTHGGDRRYAELR